jgi:hypothetical protein
MVRAVVTDGARLAMICLAMCLASELVVDTRLRLAAIDVARRAAVSHGQPMPPAVVQPQPVTRVGKSVLEVFDSVISIVR